MVYGLWQKEDSFQKIGVIVNCGFYCVNVYYIGRAYYYCHKKDGILGAPHEIEGEDHEAKTPGDKKVVDLNYKPPS